MPDARPSLRRRLLLGLLGYVILLSVAVAVHGLVVNERAEQLVWQTLLTAELDHLAERIRNDPDYQWSDTRDMALYDTRRPGPVPASLLRLAPGVHDGVKVDGQERVVLVRGEDGHRSILTLDISDIEAREQDMTLTVVGSALTLLLVLGLLAAWGASRLVSPLSLMAKRIQALRPDRQGQRLELPRGATAELEVIGKALNDYLSSNDQFVERERLFIDMASHELRTPIAVIASASELALGVPDNPSGTRLFLDRIQRAAKGVQALIGLLLVLAKDPARLRQTWERVALAPLLARIVEDHRFLMADKDLAIELQATEGAEVEAPPQIVQAAIGNLLRNAIENSDRGAIVVRVSLPAVVVIDDPGHGMSPDEISQVYARLAKGGGDRGGTGIGLDLIARLCEHLGWRLEIQSDGNGTRTVLDMGSTAGGPGSGGSVSA